MNQMELAEECGITPQYMSSIANKRKDAGTTLSKMLAHKTNTNPELWVDGSREKRLEVLAMLRIGKKM